MTEEELKKIEAPNAEKKPLTERQKKRNTTFLQLGGSLLLFVFACIIVPVSLIGTKFFLVVKMGRDENSLTTILSVVMFVGIVLAWWLSRQVCKAIVKRYKTEKFQEDVVQFYLG